MAYDSTRDQTNIEQRVESIWRGAYRWLTIGLVLTVAGAAFETLAVATTLPKTVAELGGLALYGWVFSAFMLMNLLGIVVAGSEIDRLGPGRPFVVGVLLFVAGLLTAGWTPSMEVLIGGRAVQGFGAGLISAVAYATVGRGYPEALRPKMIAITSSAWVIPGLVGPALAGLIADQAGWRWVFLGLAPLMLIAATLALPALRRLSATTDAPRDWNRMCTALLLTVGAALLVAGLDAPLWLAVGLVSIGLLLGVPALRRLFPPGTLRAARGLPAAVATNGLLSLAFFGVDAFVPLALTAVRGQTATRAGFALTAATLCWSAGAWLQASFAPRRSRRGIVATGLGLAALAFGGVVLVLNPAVPVLFAPLVWGLAGLGVGLAFSTLTLVVYETAPADQQGTSTAALQLANVLGVALGTGIGGVIVSTMSSNGGSPARGIALQTVLMLGVLGVAALAALRLPGRPDATVQRQAECPKEQIAL